MQQDLLVLHTSCFKTKLLNFEELLSNQNLFIYTELVFITLLQLFDHGTTMPPEFLLFGHQGKFLKEAVKVFTLTNTTLPQKYHFSLFLKFSLKTVYFE